MKQFILSSIIIFSTLVSFAQTEHPVKWSYEAKRVNTNTAMLYIKAHIEPDWHLYSQFIKPGGPVKTTFSFLPSRSFSPIGNVIEPKAVTRDEKVFNMVVSYFEEYAVFKQPIKVLDKKPFTVTGTVEFMVCNDVECLPPAEVKFEIHVE